MAEEAREERSEQKEPESEEKQGKKVSHKAYQKALDELEKAKADCAYWKNEYYKAYADTQNLRKSLESDRRDAIKYRAEGFLESLLPSLDAFYAVLSVPPKSEELKNYLIGFQYIYNQINQSLESEGVSEVEPKVGDRFDATFMHAVDTQEGEPGKIMKVYSKGYKLHDRLVRPAMVSVGIEKQPEKPESTEEKGQEEMKESHQA